MEKVPEGKEIALRKQDLKLDETVLKMYSEFVRQLLYYHKKVWFHLFQCSIGKFWKALLSGKDLSEALVFYLLWYHLIICHVILP